MSQASGIENSDFAESLSQELNQISQGQSSSSSSSSSSSAPEENEDTRPQIQAIYYTPKDNPIFIISLENDR